MSRFIIPLIALVLLYSCESKKTENDTEKQDIDTTHIEVQQENIAFGIKIDNYEHEVGEFKNGQSLSNVLPQYGVSYQQIDNLVKISKDTFDVRRFRTGKYWHVYLKKDSTKSCEYFVYEIDKVNYVRYHFNDSISVRLGKKPIRIDTVVSSGTINSSVWVSMQKNDIDPLLALDLSDIYAWTIDFFGIQEGDAYVVEYERKFVDTNYIGIGEVISAKFTHMNHDFYAVLFTQDSITDYFDRNGGSLRRTFLKAPLRYSRISSGFSHNRLHPILKIRRPHHGVDYAAPRGTPVYSIGDGIIKEKRYAGGYGNMVMVKHNGTYSTRYAHLSKYAKGLKTGKFVKQGEVIGYVGSTGLSTGPHLDFRFYKNGSPVNPLKVESPPALPVDSNHIDEFNALLKLKKELLNK